VRSRWGYAVAAVLAVAGVAVGIVLVVLGVTSYVDRVEGFQRVAWPGSGEVRFDDDGGYTLYYELAGVDERGDAPLDVELRPVDGGPALALEPYGSDLSYDVSGYEGVAVASFSVDAPGRYRLTVGGSTPLSGQAAVGRSVGLTPFVPVAAGVTVAGLGVLLAVILVTVTALRRSAARRRDAVPPPGWGPPPA
jgi:hypothetical protein